MSILEKLTGRSSNDMSFFTDEEAVNSVTSYLKSINSDVVSSAKQSVITAINELNSVPGVADYIGTLDPGPISQSFDSITSNIESIQTTMEGIKDSTVAYSNASIGTKFVGTLGMLGFKALEGAFGILEDVGDAALSLVGWAAPKGGPLEKTMENLIAKDWSHDMFNFYYKSDFGKASAITEDSFIAKAAKFAGATGAFMLAGGVIAKAAKGGASLATAVAANGKKVGMIQAAVIGMGSGTEGALKSGKSMNSAALCGVGTAALSAAAAWAIGTAVEKIAGKLSAKKGGTTFKDDVVAQRSERFDKLQTLVGEDTKTAYESALREGFTTRSKLELLADHAIKSGEYNTNPEVKEMVDKIVRENVAEYLGGNNDQLSKQINQYIIDNNLVEKTIAGADDITSSRTIQNIIEDKVTSHIINSSDFPVTADQVADNIAGSIDKHGLDIDYKHIITYDESLLSEGGYHKIGAPEFCGNGNCATKYVGFTDRPVTTEIVHTAEPHTELLSESGTVFQKRIYPLNYTHQQIYDIANDAAMNGTFVEGKGRDGALFFEKLVTMGDRDVLQQVVTDPEKKSIITIFLNKVKKLNATERSTLLRYK